MTIPKIPSTRYRYAVFEKSILYHVEPLMELIDVSSLEGQAVAVDAYSLINKAAEVTGACRKLALGIPTYRHIKYCLDMVKLLEHNNVKPTFVFHGAPLDALKWLEDESVRSKYLKMALACDRINSHYKSIRYYRKAFDISSSARQLLKECFDRGLKFIVAPYDANAQLAFLHKNNLVQAVITDDPSLILFGCSRIIFKIDKYGFGYELRVSKLLDFKPGEGNLIFAGFTKEMIRHASLLCSCNYVPYALLSVRQLSSIHEILDSYTKVKNYISIKDGMDEQELKGFEEADWAYQYQRIYDPVKKEMTHLSKLPDDIPTYFDKDLNFLGKYLSEKVVIEIADGKLNPVNMKPYEDEESDRRKRPKVDEVEVFLNKKAEFFEDQESTYIYLAEGHWDTSSESSGEYDEDKAKGYKSL